MKQTLDLHLKQQVKLKLTPKLQQAIRLLQLSAQELDVEVGSMLEANPLLELDNSDSLQEMTDFLDQSHMNYEKQYEGQYERQYEGLNYPKQNPEIQKTEEMTLRQHLLWQSYFKGFSSNERLIANVIIDAISEEGYLSCHLEEIQDTLKTQGLSEFAAMTNIEAVLFKIQEFDPIGVAARNLSECLSIQLNHLPKETPWLSGAKKLARNQNHLVLLGEKNYKALSSLLQIQRTKLKGVIRLITKLNPKPGLLISQSKNSEYIVPDLILRKKNEEFIVELNMSAIPKLRFNADYITKLKSVGTERETLYYQQQFKEAQWFLKGIKNRYKTLLRVASCIIKQQTAFLEQGEEFMQGLSLQTVANMTKLHESTISRITSKKYIYTERGVFELKHFFSAKITSEDGESRSTSAIRAMIKKIIEEESQLNPLSDEQIRKILLSQNVTLTRRTISKYREAMRIQSSNKRHGQRMQSLFE